MWFPLTPKNFDCYFRKLVRQIELILKNLNENNLILLPFKGVLGKKLVGTLDILIRSFQVWHTCLSSCQPNPTSGCFLSMITQQKPAFLKEPKISKQPVDGSYQHGIIYHAGSLVLKKFLIRGYKLRGYYFCWSKGGLPVTPETLPTKEINHASTRSQYVKGNFYCENCLQVSSAMTGKLA